jgi:hypothetical protein
MTIANKRMQILGKLPFTLICIRLYQQKLVSSAFQLLSKTAYYSPTNTNPAQ